MSLGGYRLYSDLDILPSDRKYARIDLSALRKNYRILHASLKERKPNVRMIAVVKADAYGHGASECVRALVCEGCDFFAVSCIEEAISVRKCCDTADILILGYTEPSFAPLLSEYRLIQALVSESYAIELDRCAQARGVRLSVHAAVNTGMNRIGFDARSDEEIENAAEEILRASALPCLDMCGMFTHFACADEMQARGMEMTRLQARRYCALREAIERRGGRIPFHHTCNSAGALSGAVDLFDGVRMGILLYGAVPALHGGLPLSSVMTLRASVLHTYRLPRGERVGYGSSFSADTDREIAVIGVGYADGWLRDYSGAEVLIKTAKGQHRVPIVGRICMDQCMLDVTGTDARVGDLVILFGDGSPLLSELSARAQTIDYETLCLISSRVPRRYSDGEETFD